MKLKRDIGERLYIMYIWVTVVAIGAMLSFAIIGWFIILSWLLAAV